ncbi:spidroin-1-like [Erinaceus europaeus]|uniref:Spidroin-1-like n=1 Tax=Erinaceus europaeus TaxID=9365 RepID=A0ABM3YC62_ERIEU|nr:spidroin-1-like [Erinaceus europaeus]
MDNFGKLPPEATLPAPPRLPAPRRGSGRARSRRARPRGGPGAGLQAGERGGRRGGGGALRGAGLGGRAQHSGLVSPERKFASLSTLQAASSGAARRLSVLPGEPPFPPHTHLCCTSSGLANFEGPAAPRAHVRTGCGARPPGAAACARARSLPPARGGRKGARETRGSALRGAGGPGRLGGRGASSGSRSRSRGWGALAAAAAAASAPPGPRRCLCGRRAARGFPGSASGEEPLSPAPSRSCGGSVSRGRARRRRRRGERGAERYPVAATGEQPARGGGGGGGLEPGPGASPAQTRLACASETRGRAAVPTLCVHWRDIKLQVLP